MVESYESTTTRIAALGAPTCTLIQDLLPLYLEGEVSSGSRDLIVEHLGRCERCAGFLAGAQSVRGQLRRDLAQRQTMAATGAPEQRALGLFRRLLVGGAAVGLCVIGGLASIGLASGLATGEAGPAVAGMIFGMGAFIMLFLLTSAMGQIRAGRLWQLCAGVGTGTLAGFILASGLGAASLFAVILAVLAIGVVVAAVMAPVRQLAPAARATSVPQG